MLLQINDIIDPARLQVIKEKIAAMSDEFHDGKITAGSHAGEVKNNEQISNDGAIAITSLIGKILCAHPVFMAAARPHSFGRMLISRYQPGMSYGRHVDDALMDGKRTDLSFTLFLSDPQTYEGGALIIEDNDGESEIKLPAGSLIVYPSTSLHQVSEVTSGERLAIVGWIRSFIRQTEARELLFDLDRVLVGLREGGVDRSLLDRLLKIKANLLRLWAED